MEGHLMLSSNTWGRYALRVDGDEHGDITSGQPLEVGIGGQWISGRIEYDQDPTYVTLGPQSIEDVVKMAGQPRAIGGYYFIADADGNYLGLCIGMRVRLL